MKKNYKVALTAILSIMLITGLKLNVFAHAAGGIDRNSFQRDEYNSDIGNSLSKQGLIHRADNKVKLKQKTTIKEMFEQLKLKEEMDNDKSITGFALIGKYTYSLVAVDDIGYPSMFMLAEMNRDGEITYYNDATEDSSVLTGMVVCQEYDKNNEFGTSRELKACTEIQIGNEDLEGMNVGIENEELWNYFDERVITIRGLIDKDKFDEGTTYRELLEYYDKKFEDKISITYKDIEGVYNIAKFIQVRPQIKIYEDYKIDDTIKTGDIFVIYIDNITIDNEKIPQNFPINLLNIIYKAQVEAGAVIRGDITGTGEVDITDLSTLQEEMVENINLEDEAAKAADMNDDGEVDITDLSELSEYIVNK